jgi:hypothetical protein
MSIPSQSHKYIGHHEQPDGVKTLHILNFISVSNPKKVAVGR